MSKIPFLPYDDGFTSGANDKRHLEHASDETRMQILARYAYAMNHQLAHPFHAGYVDGFNSVAEKDARDA